LDINSDILFFENYQKYLYENYKYTMDKLNATTLFWHYDKNSDLRKFRETGYHNYHLHYSKHLHKERLKVTKILELGVFKGHSMLMWADYFPNAKIYGIDIDFSNKNFGVNALELVKNNKRIQLIQLDAYSNDTVNYVKNNWGDDFDLIIDDGSHHPYHQLFFILYYQHLIKPKGQLIIEDVFMENLFEPDFLEYYDSSYKAFKTKRFFFDTILQTKNLKALDYQIEGDLSIDLSNYNISIEDPVDYTLEFKNINLNKENTTQTFNNRQGIVFLKQK